LHGALLWVYARSLRGVATLDVLTQQWVARGAPWGRSHRREGGEQLAGEGAPLDGHRGAVARALSSRAVTCRAFALVPWRSAYVSHGKSEGASALTSRCVLLHQRKSSQKLSGINCVATTIQLTGQEPATFECL